MGGWNFISRVYCLAASFMWRLLREKTGESSYMPRNFSELTNGGYNSYAVPPTLKSGGTRHTRPPPIDARGLVRWLRSAVRIVPNLYAPNEDGRPWRGSALLAGGCPA